MNLRHIDDSALLETAERLAREERDLNTRILWHLREIDRRRLHLARGFQSLHEYLVQSLHYSDGAASRRLRAMRLLTEIPEVEEALQSGRLNLSTVSTAQSFFQREAQDGRKVYSPDEKREILKQVEYASRRECEQVLHAISPQSLPQERERVLTANETELRVVVSDELFRKLGQVRELVTGKGSRIAASYAEALAEMAELYLERKDPERKLARTAARRRNAVTNADAATATQPAANADVPTDATAVADTVVFAALTPASPEKLAGRRAPASHQFKVYQRDGYQCDFRDSVTGRRCQARRRLELDHRQPWALGGPTHEANLRWLCRNHNQLSAIRCLGERKMKRFIPTLR